MQVNKRSAIGGSIPTHSFVELYHYADLEPSKEVPDDRLQWLLDAGEWRAIAEGDVVIDVGD